jgi:Flp pilus assembly pilin Flp
MYKKLTDKVTELAVAAKVYDARSVVKDVARRLRRDESGAAMIEYSVLLSIILAATIAIILLVGGKVTAAWTALNAAWNP